jgi:hypothetical protein
MYRTEDGDESDDDDVQVGGVTQDYKCPISLTPLVDPVTSYVAPLLRFSVLKFVHLVNFAAIPSRKLISGTT